MTAERPSGIVSRRTTIAALTAAGLGVALSSARPVAAQDPGMADHPMVGTWLVRTLDGAVGPSYIQANGAFIHSGSPVSVGPDGSVSYMSPQNGLWEPDPENERGIHFTSIQSTFDMTGAYTGTWTIDGYPVASEDGETFSDDWARSTVTIRDATNAVVAVLGNDGSMPVIAGVRMHVGEPPFPESGTTGATPQS
jgi:hypothetical protein